ncbi:MAG: hypothetical protein IIZ39_11785, partial [Blautia sp.]|nr:hypothetical protein [Blautia sp.]
KEGKEEREERDEQAIHSLTEELEEVLDSPSLPMYYYEAMEYLLEGFYVLPEEEIKKEWELWEGKDASSFLAQAFTAYLLCQTANKEYMPGAMKDVLRVAMSFGKDMGSPQEALADFPSLWKRAGEETWVRKRMESLITSLLSFGRGDEESLQEDVAWMLDAYYKQFSRLLDSHSLPMEGYEMFDWILENMEYCGYPMMVEFWEEKRSSINQLYKEFLLLVITVTGYWRHRNEGLPLLPGQPWELFRNVYDVLQEEYGDLDLLTYLRDTWRLIDISRSAE